MNNNNSIRIEGKRIRLPKLGMIKFHTKQLITGKISSVTVSKDNSGKYHVAILCKDVPKKKCSKNNERSCGIDLGITNFVTINTGEIIRFPEQNKITHLDKKKEKIALEALFRKQSRGNNRQKTKEKLSGVMKKYTTH